MTNFTDLRDRLRKRAAYKRTVFELKNLPIDTALDLDINKSDAEKIAHRSVYGA